MTVRRIRMEMRAGGWLDIYFVGEDRLCCEHVRDGAPTREAPPGTITRGGTVYSWEMCRICSALHTLTAEQRARQAFDNAMAEVELRSKDQES